MRERLIWFTVVVACFGWGAFVFAQTTSMRADRTINFVEAQTIADSGDGSPALLTLSPVSSYVEITCNDVDTCDVTMGEAGVEEGRTLTLVNVSAANVVDFVDTVGVTEIAGVFAAGPFDSLTLRYTGAEWFEVARSDN